MWNGGMVMNRQVYETIAKLKKLVIPHPQYTAAFDQIIEAYQLNDIVNVQQHLLCIGSSGTGKSTLKNKIAARYPTYSTDSQKIIPVLVIDTPSLPTVKNMAEAVLVQLGDPKFSRGSAVEKTTRILFYLKACDVKLIIFDELQHFMDQGSKAAPRQVSDWLKTLIDQSGASTVLMGLEQSEYLLQINEQLRRRFSRRIDLKAFDLTLESDYWDFVRVIQTLDKALALNIPCVLTEDLVKRYHFATNGVIDYMVKLMIAAYVVSVRLQLDTINAYCLADAFNEAIWSEAPKEMNPFNGRFKFNSLTKLGMPFHTPARKRREVVI
jgi:hypothetical protein